MIVVIKKGDKVLDFHAKTPESAVSGVFYSVYVRWLMPPPFPAGKVNGKFIIS